MDYCGHYWHCFERLFSQCPTHAGKQLSIKNQRRLNPHIQGVLNKDIVKWLDARVIYLVGDRSWLYHFQCMPKKGWITVVPNSKNKVTPMMLVTAWRMCIDYRKINTWVDKDEFSMTFME